MLINRLVLLSRSNQGQGQVGRSITFRMERSSLGLRTQVSKGKRSRIFYQIPLLKQPFYSLQTTVLPLPKYNQFAELRIDKGSRAVNYILGCSSGNISCTRTLYISYERSYFSPSHNITFLIFRLEFRKL